MAHIPQKRAHIIYSGTVQGVGFRWTAEALANSIGLGGWVQNCPDGSVEVVCEGGEKDISAFTARIKKEMNNYIRSEKVNWEIPTGEFEGFNIKFYY
ncbi:acylphosphatase [Candidatus Omnitrophota bacterium]